MLEHLDADVAALQVHADQGHHRFARIRGCVGDVGGQHHIAQQPALARLLRVGLAIGLDIGRLAHAGREGLGAGKHLGAGHALAQRGRGRFGAQIAMASPEDSDGAFHFCRIWFQSGRGNGGGWGVADTPFKRVRVVTTVDFYLR